MLGVLIFKKCTCFIFIKTNRGLPKIETVDCYFLQDWVTKRIQRKTTSDVDLKQLIHSYIIAFKWTSVAPMLLQLESFLRSYVFLKYNS